MSDSSSIDSLAFVDLNRGFCTYQKLGVFGESESPWSPRGTFQQAGRLLVRFREIVLVVLEPLRQTRRQGNEGEEHHRGQPRPSHPVAARQFSRPPERFVRSVDELEHSDRLVVDLDASSSIRPPSKTRTYGWDGTVLYLGYNE